MMHRDWQVMVESKRAGSYHPNPDLKAFYKVLHFTREAWQDDGRRIDRWKCSLCEYRTEMCSPAGEEKPDIRQQWEMSRHGYDAHPVD